jgi:hypothetical protein
MPRISDLSTGCDADELAEEERVFHEGGPMVFSIVDICVD